MTLIEWNKGRKLHPLDRLGIAHRRGLVGPLDEADVVASGWAGADRRRRPVPPRLVRPPLPSPPLLALMRRWRRNPATPAQPEEVQLPTGKQATLGLVSVDGGQDESGCFAVSASLDSVISRWAVSRPGEGGDKLEARKVLKPGPSPSHSQGQEVLTSPMTQAQSFTVALHPTSSSPVLATTGSSADITVLDASSGPSFGDERAKVEGRGSFGMSIAYVRPSSH